MRLFTLAGLLAVVTAGCFEVAYGADAYAPLRLYEGTWKTASQSVGGAATTKIIATSAPKSGNSSAASRRSMENRVG